jgi:hypothetical protein
MLKGTLSENCSIKYHAEGAMKQLFPKLTCLLIALILVLPNVVPGRAAEPLLVRSVGLLDTDGTVLYSVILASGPQALGKLIVTGGIPDGTELVEILNAPPDTAAQSQSDGVSWQVKALDADTILGPFTYRVRLKEKSATPPLTSGAMVSWTDPELGSIEATQSKGTLVPLADSGSIAIDNRGTLNEKGENDVVPVGKTGIVIYVPVGAVSQPTTLTFNRLVIDDKNVPTDQTNVWWCALVNITSNPAVTFSKSITLALPTRLPTFTDNLAQDKFPAARAFGAPSGNHVVISQFVMNSAQSIVTPGFLKEDRARAVVHAPNLPTSQISDGTSNTALGYVEQDNIIAILIGRR